ncbi:MAG: signal peptidase II [Clostridia bacterium]
MVYYFIAAGIIVLDQIVKCAVLNGMYAGQTIPLIENVFHLTYIQNRGAAFSMWEQQWIVLVVIFTAVVLAAGLASIWIKRVKWSRVTLTSVAFICGGGIGNLIDRITRRVCGGYVRLQVHTGDRFPGVQCGGHLHMRGMRTASSGCHFSGRKEG